MKFYSAMYQIDSQEYSSFIYAQDREAAMEMVKQRNLGEKILGELRSKSFAPHPLPSEQYEKRDLIECVHTLTFYSWLAAKAGVIDPTETLSDRGVLHEILHEMHHPDVYAFRENIRDRLISLEKSIPGLISYVAPSVDAVQLLQ
jgi:hypothetical protein